MSTYFAILTAAGEAKLANAAALGTTINLTQMAVGDGNGATPAPTRMQTALVNEKRRAALNRLDVDPLNPSQIIVEQVLPENVGGWWIRELGIYDQDGDLCAIANCPPSYKPELSEGSGRTQVVRMVLIVSSATAVQLKIDPAVVLATRQYADDAITVSMNAHLATANPHSQYVTKLNPLATATPAQFDSSLKLATTEFVRRNGLQFALPILINAATVLTIAQSGKFILLTGTGHTTNLPSVASSVDGATFYFKNNGTGVMGIQKNAADVALTIDGTPATLCTLAVGESVQATFISTIGAWDISGIGALQYSKQFARSAAANGYQKLPGGLIFQWGVGAITYTTDTAQDVYFPIAFPTACIFCLVGDVIGAGGGVMNHLFNFATTTKVSCYSTMSIANGYVAHMPNYVAIGY